ncbi:MAG: hypothetical protein KA712_03370 [Myxococcales bacterium]|nr:hypothetical protein [Myxococcales bacterium]
MNYVNHRLPAAVWGLVLVLFGCGGNDTEGGEPPGPPEVRLGTPDAETELSFDPLEPGEPIRYAGSGQSGLFLRMGLRAKHLGADVTALVRVTDTTTGLSVEESFRFQMVCETDTGWCTEFPVYLRATSLGTPQELDGRKVTVYARVSTKQGWVAEATTPAVLEML